MLKKILPIVLLVLVTACADMGASGAAGMANGCECCQKCECCKKGECACCKDGMCKLKGKDAASSKTGKQCEMCKKHTSSDSKKPEGKDAHDHSKK